MLWMKLDESMYIKEYKIKIIILEVGTFFFSLSLFEIEVVED
jgi:hypothetical protein